MGSDSNMLTLLDINFISRIKIENQTFLSLHWSIYVDFIHSFLMSTGYTWTNWLDVTVHCVFKKVYEQQTVTTWQYHPLNDNIVI